ncbi:MAG TPA: V4R domain-containing protein [Gemmatimonadales bacterium]|jgi:predicted hydrocarbon binding protein
MTDISLSASGLVAVSARAFHALRDRVGAQALQEAGYAAGEGTYQAFVHWLPGHASVDDPKELAAPRLAEVLSTFFSSLGWGSVEVTALGDAAVAFDSPDWAEAQPGASIQYPGCYFTAGLLADFMSRIGDAPLAVMEVECRSRGDARCRWLVGAPDTLQALYQHMAQGADYMAVLGA